MSNKRGNPPYKEINYYIQPKKDEENKNFDDFLNLISKKDEITNNNKVDSVDKEEKDRAEYMDLVNKINLKNHKMKFKYREDDIIKDFHNYIIRTYGEHYKFDDSSLECFDIWIANGTSSTTFKDNAEKYLLRYGKKNGKNKDDLLKALHYILMVLYVDHYKDK